jgi:murein L,D-transpeptidase YafK
MRHPRVFLAILLIILCLPLHFLSAQGQLRFEPLVIGEDGVRSMSKEEALRFDRDDAQWRRAEAQRKREGVAAARERMKSLFQTHGFTHRDLRNVRLVLHKANRKLELFVGDTLLKTFRVGLGGNPEGAKRVMGDQRTPEGRYYIMNKNWNSHFHLFLGVSYPNGADAQVGFEAGTINKTMRDRIVRLSREKRPVPQQTRLGGLIGIHGGGAASDWTLGCIAVRNPEIEELWNVVRVGTPLEIHP